MKSSCILFQELISLICNMDYFSWIWCHSWPPLILERQSKWRRLQKNPFSHFNDIITTIEFTFQTKIWNDEIMSRKANSSTCKNYLPLSSNFSKSLLKTYGINITSFKCNERVAINFMITLSTMAWISHQMQVLFWQSI